MDENKQDGKFGHIARESMAELLTEANERGIDREDFVDITVKGNTFYLVYWE